MAHRTPPDPCVIVISRIAGDLSRTTLLPLLFFFSSRRRHTRSLCDWSSDVCSSDLTFCRPLDNRRCLLTRKGSEMTNGVFFLPLLTAFVERTPELHLVPSASVPSPAARSEERRVGKEGRSRW